MSLLLVYKVITVLKTRKTCGLSTPGLLQTHDDEHEEVNNNLKCGKHERQRLFRIHLECLLPIRTQEAYYKYAIVMQHCQGLFFITDAASPVFTHEAFKRINCGKNSKKEKTPSCSSASGGAAARHSRSCWAKSSTRSTNNHVIH